MISAYRGDRDRHLGADCHSHARAGTNSFYNVIAAADCCFVSAISYQEAGQVIYARAGINGVYDLEDFLALIERRGLFHTTCTLPLSRSRHFAVTVRASTPKRV